MKKLIAILFLITSSLLQAQSTGTIKGTVRDLISNKPIYLASVWVRSGGNLIGTTTDFDGRFTLKPLNPGTYDLFAKDIDHDTLSMSNVVVNPEKITFTPDLKLSINQLDIFTKIEYVIPLIDRDKPELIRISAKEIVQRSDARDAVQMVANMTPGAKKTDDGQQLYFRGSRPQNTSTFIDGVKMVNGSIPNLPKNAISSISVYTGGVPAKYGDVTGGVIVIETKTFMDLWNQRQADMRKAEMN